MGIGLKTEQNGCPRSKLQHKMKADSCYLSKEKHSSEWQLYLFDEDFKSPCLKNAQSTRKYWNSLWKKDQDKRSFHCQTQNICGGLESEMSDLPRWESTWRSSKGTRLGVSAADSNVHIHFTAWTVQNNDMSYDKRHWIRGCKIVN